MPKQVALFLCLIFISWLFIRDKKLRPMTSMGLWYTLVWIAIIGSKPVSYWFGTGIETEESFNYLDGSPLDRNVFLFLIIGGSAVLLRRKIDWREIFASNRWFFAFFLYCFISILWSDYPFVSFKRWTKELGNIIMILILITERDPVLATKAVLARYTYLAIPLSVIFIKYFPDIGRYYNNYTWTAAFSGVATSKNGLGAVLFMCGLFLVWDLTEMRSANGEKKNKAQSFADIALLLMVFWLLIIAKSSTALVCFVLGAGVIILMRSPSAQRQVRHLGAYSVAIGFLMILLYSFPDIIKVLASMVGRDVTFTGRTELWSHLLGMSVNPLFGSGYQSFWLGPRMEGLWESFNFHPVQAHNGYLETYLNIGLIGACLLLAMIVSTGNKLKKEILSGSSYASFRFSLLFAVIVYNWTEAMFSGLNVIWTILLISALTYPRSSGFMPEQEKKPDELTFPLRT